MAPGLVDGHTERRASAPERAANGTEHTAPNVPRGALQAALDMSSIEAVVTLEGTLEWREYGSCRRPEQERAIRR